MIKYKPFIQRLVIFNPYKSAADDFERMLAKNIEKQSENEIMIIEVGPWLHENQFLRLITTKFPKVLFYRSIQNLFSPAN